MKKKATKTNVIQTMICNAAFVECRTSLRKDQMYRDPCGFYWCEEHKYRGRLLGWAKRHEYPPIEFMGSQPYAIGDKLEDSQTNEMLWKTAVVLGSDDMIWSALSEVMGMDDEGEEAI